MTKVGNSSAVHMKIAGLLAGGGITSETLPIDKQNMKRPVI